MEISYPGEPWELIQDQASELSNQRLKKLEYLLMHQLLILSVEKLEKKGLRQLEVCLTTMVRPPNRVGGRGVSCYIGYT